MDPKGLVNRGGLEPLLRGFWGAGQHSLEKQLSNVFILYLSPHKAAATVGMNGGRRSDFRSIIRLVNAEYGEGVDEVRSSVSACVQYPDEEGDRRSARPGNLESV